MWVLYVVLATAPSPDMPLVFTYVARERSYATQEACEAAVRLINAADPYMPEWDVAVAECIRDDAA